MFRFNSGISTSNDGFCQAAPGRYQVAILEFFVLLILSLPQHNRVKLFGSVTLPLFQ
ncbi:hypothetical protein [Umezakia ovalisporum]|jgi:hypothetical protein|uniref:hypothetical protein n=1 Tax=Umezakia ovalisporum TaxID=75695 RepID=UPI002474AF4F|nr:hypothetical protein [Umezakia ovalisporum]MDH6071120.1 hypothetical protein [Umezakia ovalisporum CobakiLakeA]MDH6074855.1 hypothetical protein [Umezakia ovalisporum CS-1034]MDH6081923.1 hypothetical protein [Umezakia ovalisporum FSS-44]MDH6085582.1 hypothetical protein [Umezakia ovalisporum TAC611]